MTKKEILDYFSLIDFAYNESGRFESLSRMLDELLKEQEAVVRCKDCKYRFVDGDNVRFNMCLLNHNKVQPDGWFCADGERKDNNVRTEG